MTIELFVFLFTFGSAISALLTQAIKKIADNISSNIIALIDAFVLGFIGTIIFYIMMGVIFTPENICWIILMSFAIWLGSMVGYDKIIQTIAQIRR